MKKKRLLGEGIETAHFLLRPRTCRTLLDTFSCPRRARLTLTSAPWAWVGAAGRTSDPPTLGSHIALKRAPKGAGGGLGARAPAHRVGHGAVASRGAVPGVRSSCARAVATGRANGPPPLGSHLALM
eukprot:scaffold133435_cov70-Phaeocystis_antarctica.AAC.2